MTRLTWYTYVILDAVFQTKTPQSPLLYWSVFSRLSDLTACWHTKHTNWKIGILHSVNTIQNFIEYQNVNTGKILSLVEIKDKLPNVAEILTFKIIIPIFYSCESKSRHILKGQQPSLQNMKYRYRNSHCVETKGMKMDLKIFRGFVVEISFNFIRDIFKRSVMYGCMRSLLRFVQAIWKKDNKTIKDRHAIG